MKPIYYRSRSQGKGFCWFDNKKTNMTFDNGNEEYFCCPVCFVRYIKNFKGKSRILRKLRLKIEQVPIRRKE